MLIPEAGQDQSASSPCSFEIPAKSPMLSHIDSKAPSQTSPGLSPPELSQALGFRGRRRCAPSRVLKTHSLVGPVLDSGMNPAKAEVWAPSRPLGW